MSDHNDAIEMAAKIAAPWETFGAQPTATDRAVIDVRQKIAASIRSLKRPDAPAATEAALRRALESFARLADGYESFDGQHDFDDDFIAFGDKAGEYISDIEGKRPWQCITVADLRRARQALSASPAPQKPEPSAEEVEAAVDDILREDEFPLCIEYDDNGLSRRDYVKFAQAVLIKLRAAAITRSPSVERALHGWKLVPVEPTQAMIDAGLYQSSKDTNYEDLYSAWKEGK